MIQCSYCGKELNVVFVDGGYHVDTCYYKGEGPDRKYYCDAKCSLDAHEKERELLKLLGGKDGR